MGDDILCLFNDSLRFWGICGLVIDTLLISSAFLSMQWLCRDDPNQRKRLIISEALMISYAISISVLELCAWKFGDVPLSPPGHGIPLFDILLYAYVYYIAVQYSKAHAN